MSLSIVVKIGAALGVGGLVYWTVSRWGASSASAATGPAQTTAQDAKKTPPVGPPVKTKPKDYGDIDLGTAHAADDAGGTVLGSKAIQNNILKADRETVRPGYHVSPTETWRDPGDNSLYAIWFRNSDGVRGVFYEGLFRRMG